MYSESSFEELSEYPYQYGVNYIFFDINNISESLRNTKFTGTDICHIYDIYYLA